MSRNVVLHTDPRAVRIIQQWQSPIEEIRHEHYSLRIRVSVLLLALTLGSSLAATPLISIARVVTSTEGQIVSRVPSTTFQALEASIIRSIDVKEGQIVDRGQLLAMLDPTIAVADVGQLRQQIAGLDAQVARARAEAKAEPFTIPSELTPAAMAYWTQQKSYFDQRAQQYASQLKGFDEKVSTTEATLAKLAGDQARFVEREKITKQVEDMRTTLFKAGASSLVSLLQASDDRLRLLQSLNNGQGGLAEIQHQVAAAKADRDAFVHGWIVALNQEIVNAQNQLDAAAASLEKAARRQDLVRLTAPRPAVVLSLSKLSVGSVLRQGDELMQLAPLDAPVEAEIYLNARDIGYVRAGDPVAFKVAAFNSYEHGEGEGHLTFISENAFTDGGETASPQPPYYKARVAIDAMRFHDVMKDFRLVPGMTLTADVRVGTRSAFTYILGGFSRGIGETMRGP